MKRAHPAEMVAHLWANQSQPSAYTANRNLYYDGSTIYSYGSHFPIARHTLTGKGKYQRKCVLFNSGRYSNTTNKHQAAVRDAIRGGVPVFTVPRIEGLYGSDLSKDAHKENLDHYQTSIANQTAKAMRARVNGDWLISAAASLVKEANEYAAFFKLRKRFKLPSSADIQAINAKASAERKQRAKQIAAANAAREDKLRVAAEEWLRGERDSIPYGYNKTLLRIRGSRVETSRGAVVEIESAKRILPPSPCRKGMASQRRAIEDWRLRA